MDFMITVLRIRVFIRGGNAVTYLQVGSTDKDDTERIAIELVEARVWPERSWIFLFGQKVLLVLHVLKSELLERIFVISLLECAWLSLQPLSSVISRVLWWVIEENHFNS